MITLTLETKDGTSIQKNSVVLKDEIIPLCEIFDAFVSLLDTAGFTPEEIHTEIGEIYGDKIREMELTRILAECQRQ